LCPKHISIYYRAVKQRKKERGDHSEEPSDEVPFFLPPSRVALSDGLLRMIVSFVVKE
jgi:hypothetical protein